MFKQKYYSLLLFSYFTLFGTQGYAFNLDDDSWPTPSTIFHVDIPGAGGLWNSAFETAMFRWNSATIFTYFIVRDSFIDPCQNPFLVEPANGVKFSSTVCGDAFGSTTLAIETSWITPSNNSITRQSGIIFNSNESWNVYSGPLDSILNDFRRVAVHELGHSIGLLHEDSVSSIMSTFAGNTEVPLQDDINAVNILYGGGGNGGGGAGDEVILDFGTAGLWIWQNNRRFVKLHSQSPEFMVTGDLDGNGQDEVIVDFGAGGLWIWQNNRRWVKLHSRSPEFMVTGDLDGNGQDEVVVDFGAAGLWTKLNSSSWVKLHSGSPETMVTGNVDGN